MGNKIFSIIFLSIFLLGVLSACGEIDNGEVKVKDNDDSLETGKNVKIIEDKKKEETGKSSDLSSLKSCSEQNGNICKISDSCSNWLDASNTFLCCKSECIKLESKQIEINILSYESDEDDNLDLVDIEGGLK